ncbi:uncharacterized protein LOC110112451 [Dendrobium catenatum]|uniref:uncharacterized protein LOC110112451 n=1 Tax=Dendrobium catenatum TaxID=906689 RepID=UPI00109F9DA7|nr:uncharacterized protein LOC110112451 [Dendrobium catenatum]
MRVHPTPRKRNMAFGPASPAVSATGRLKKLRRLPHVFSKVLELPFCADADVHVEEEPTGFRFIATAIGVSASFRTQFIEIHPGIMKLVVRNNEAGDVGFEEEELQLDRWRVRLPASTRPALATAECIRGELIVRVPKGAGIDEGG